MEKIIKIELFGLKPCNVCPQSCVEGNPNEICPFDKLFIDEKNQK